MDLQREIESASRYEHPLSLILFDLDHFKKINDSHLAERIRVSIAEIELGQRHETTASFGISEHTPHDFPESLIKRADEALYNAKAAGRNRVESIS